MKRGIMVGMLAFAASLGAGIAAIVYWVWDDLDGLNSDTYPNS